MIFVSAIGSLSHFALALRAGLRVEKAPSPPVGEVSRHVRSARWWLRILFGSFAILMAFLFFRVVSEM